MRPDAVQQEIDHLPLEGYDHLRMYIERLEKQAMLAEVQEWIENAPDGWIEKAAIHANALNDQVWRSRPAYIDEIINYSRASHANALSMRQWIRRFHGAAR